MKESIQEQLIAARKKQILESAARIFANKGFHASTIKEIAKDAGTADGTIYIYFKNKHELLLGIFEEMQAVIFQNMPDEIPLGTDLKAVLKGFLQTPLQQLKADNFGLFRVIVSEILVNDDLRKRYYEKILIPTLNLAEEQLRRLAAAGLIADENIGLVVRSISGMLMGLILENIMGDELVKEHWDELAEFLAALLLKGLEKR